MYIVSKLLILPQNEVITLGKKAFKTIDKKKRVLSKFSEFQHHSYQSPFLFNSVPEDIIISFVFDI